MDHFTNDAYDHDNVTLDQVLKLIQESDAMDRETDILDDDDDDVVDHEVGEINRVTGMTHDGEASNRWAEVARDTELKGVSAVDDGVEYRTQLYSNETEGCSDGHAVMYLSDKSHEEVDKECTMGIGNKDEDERENKTEIVHQDGVMKGGPYSFETVTMCMTMAKKKRRSIRMKKSAVFLFKHFLVFLISHVGLTFLVIAYSIVGAVMFMNIEANNEIQNRYLVARVRRQHVKELWKATKDLNVLFKSNWTIIADDVFTRFQSSVYTAVSNGWDGVDEATDVAAKWNYPGALLYSVSVITTIGYGHLTPQTELGRIATMLYALIGIPITLVCISNIGSLMAKAFKIFWQNCACLCKRRKRTKDGVIKHEKKKKKKEVRVPIVICLLLMFGYIILGAMLFHLWEKDWTYFESAYFCFITLSTIGFGDFVPGQSNRQWEDTAKRVTSTLYLLFGLALMAMCFELMQDEVKEACLDFMRCVRCCKKSQTDDNATDDSEPNEDSV